MGRDTTAKGAGMSGECVSGIMLCIESGLIFLYSVCIPHCSCVGYIHTIS
jgi:hypothetical protein